MSAPQTSPAAATDLPAGYGQVRAVRTILTVIVVGVVAFLTTIPLAFVWSATPLVVVSIAAAPALVAATVVDAIRLHLAKVRAARAELVAAMRATGLA